MADRQSWAANPAVRRSMQSNKSRDTAPEIALRKRLFALGLRYRVCRRPTPDIRNRVDIVFPSAQVAVELLGCFWHGCPEHYRAPATNNDYWAEKIRINQARDARLAEQLGRAGWHLVTIWEHDDLDLAADEIAAAVRFRASALAQAPGPR